MHGVNLGNWLVLEKWMGDSPLADAVSPDDHGLIAEIGDDERAEVLRRHFDTYVDEGTFAWLAEVGVDLVRIPVPYHLFGTAHHTSCVAWLDRAFAWAEAYGLAVLVDLHTVPMGHNAFDNGGYLGMCTWHTSPSRIDFVVDLLARIAARYAGHPSLWGVEALNEPASKRVLRAHLQGLRKRFPERVAASRAISHRRLAAFYERIWSRLRPILGSEAMLVFHDQFEGGRWDRLLARTGDDAICLDTHRYLNFSEHLLRSDDLDSYLALVDRFEDEVRRMARRHPVIVGEWSVATHSSVVRDLDDTGRDAWYRALADSQVKAWDKVGGGVYWSLKVAGESRVPWSFMACVERGWVDYRRVAAQD